MNKLCQRIMGKLLCEQMNRFVKQTFRGHPGQLRHFHVEVLAEGFIFDLLMINRLQNFPLFGLKACEGRLQVHHLFL